MAEKYSKRESNRIRRRQEYLDVASRMVIDRGFDGLTMQAIADEVGAAVGTIYTYFSSKSALVAELQSMAIVGLGKVHQSAQTSWKSQLQNQDPVVAALASLGAFGNFVPAVGAVYPEEVLLQQRLLVERDNVLDEADAAVVFGPCLELASRPAGLIDAATKAGALAEGDSFGRSAVWMASLNGVLLLDGLARYNVPGLEDIGRLCHDLTFDLLRGWDAPREPLRVAEGLVLELKASPSFVPVLPRWTDTINVDEVITLGTGAAAN